MKKENLPKIVIVSIYFGKLPDYFDLWLASCGRNPKFNWIFITDASLDCFTIPPNVVVKKSTLTLIAEILTKKLEFPVALNTPYKLCDFRPVYWMILNEFRIECDFWGHCDIDVIFGRLEKFITPDLLLKNDRVFGLGHLSLVRNSPLANLVFAMPGSTFTWKSIFSNSKNIGFDEHWGVNRTWTELPLSFYQNEEMVADIDPQFEKFYLTQIPFNKKNQIFYLDKNAVFQGYLNAKGVWLVREFAYIHFQKRKMPKSGDVTNCEILLIGPKGFSPLASLPPDIDSISHLAAAEVTESLGEKFARVRSWFRFQCRRFSYDF